MWGKLTLRQREMMLTMCRLHYEGERPQSIRAIQTALGIASTNGVVGHLYLLEKKGWLRMIERKSSCNWWKIIQAPPGWVLLPGGGIVPVEEVPALVDRLIEVLQSTPAETFPA